MLKGALCLNVGIFCLAGFFLCISSFSKGSHTNWSGLAALLLVLTFVNLIIIERSVDLDWGLLLVYLIFAVTEVLFIITIIKCNISKVWKTGTPLRNASIAMIVIPILLFVITYSYELFRLNTCDYLIHYNYQNGIATSEDTYLAVTGHKPAKVTLVNNPFERDIRRKYTGIANNIFCSIIFGENGERELNLYDEGSKEYESVFDKLGAEIYNEDPSIDRIEIHYIPEENDAIVRVAADKYIYHDNKKTSKLNAVGSIRKIIVY